MDPDAFSYGVDTLMIWFGYGIYEQMPVVTCHYVLLRMFRRCSNFTNACSYMSLCIITDVSSMPKFYFLFQKFDADSTIRADSDIN